MLARSTMPNGLPVGTTVLRLMSNDGLKSDMYTDRFYDRTYLDCTSVPVLRVSSAASADGGEASAAGLNPLESF